MNNKLGGCVGMVTGASSGIGAATAKALAAAGACVALVARRKDRLEAVAAEIQAAGGTALVLEADITDQAQAQGAVAAVVAAFGRLDILVNNAGVMVIGPAADAPADEWDAMVQVNIRGLLFCSHAALPHLVAGAASSPRGVADLVNMSSISGRATIGHSAVYAMTKTGVCAFSDGIRAEYAEKNVRVSLLEPGPTDSELITHQRPAILHEIRTHMKPIEALRAEDVAEAALFIVTRDRRVAINEIMLRPIESSF